MVVNWLNDLGFLDGKPKSSSFKEALSGASSSPDFLDLNFSTCYGLPSLWISDVELLALAAPFEFALSASLLLNSKNVLIKLLNDLDYCRVFSHRSYFVSNCYMKLFKWTPLFDITIESPSILI
ncbi:hypothetical protein IEQ34_004818 [Dendrobium chrysotoxum]|uniref:Uncharacterized protein n=1 Tax=Dendrobium chrysotoxum TaxID=161865 RepID=A0AAV7GS78_DENCH|nr:hypothetical protein IEQ34_004818 [Dendrobium chrysotoxum]